MSFSKYVLGVYHMLMGTYAKNQENIERCGTLEGVVQQKLPAPLEPEERCGSAAEYNPVNSEMERIYRKNQERVFDKCGRLCKFPDKENYVEKSVDMRIN